MGFWQCKDGTMVEMIYNDNLEFERFGDNVSNEDAEKAKKEIAEWIKQQLREGR